MSSPPREGSNGRAHLVAPKGMGHAQSLALGLDRGACCDRAGSRVGCRGRKRDSPPAAKGGLDCNGFSPLQTTYRQLWCTEIAANDENGFEDNGHYVGHDEPDIGFFSNQHGSANGMSYSTILPRDPLSTPTVAFGGSTSSSS